MTTQSPNPTNKNRSFHDTGKIGMPDAILQKPDNLNAEEWIIMRRHPPIGHNILSKSKSPYFN